MTLCTCKTRPRCEYHHCRAPADWSILTLPYRWIKTWPHGRLHFMCTRCRDYYFEALNTPLKGIDRPEGADEDWKPSLMDHLRHAQIAIAFEERQSRETHTDWWREGDEKYSPQQLTNMIAWRKGLRDFKAARASA